MKKYFVSLIVFVVSSLLVLGFYAPKPDSDQEIMVKLPFRLPTKVNSIYKVTERNKIRRELPDSTVDIYEREVVYYISLFCPTFPEKGFQTLVVSVDSIAYKFSSKDEFVFFDSQVDSTFKNVRFPDLVPYIVPLGKSFELIYSPYGEVATIKGEELDWQREYVLVQGREVLDTLEKFIWLDGISFNRLAHIADVKKILFPSGFIKEDSIWKSPINFQINNINFKDTAVCQIKGRDKNDFIIVAESRNLQATQDVGLLYNIKRFSDIKNVTGKSKFNIYLMVKGVVSKTEAELEAIVDYQAGAGGYFREIYISNVSWELLSQYIK